METTPSQITFQTISKSGCELLRFKVDCFLSKQQTVSRIPEYTETTVNHHHDDDDDDDSVVVNNNRKLLLRHLAIHLIINSFHCLLSASHSSQHVVAPRSSIEVPIW